VYIATCLATFMKLGRKVVQHYPAEEVLERDYQRREAIEEKMLQ
jgi:hypothetical protein